MITFPLPVSTHIAPGANPVDASTLQYTDISSDVRYASSVAIQAGRQDETSRTDPTGQQLTLNARSGNYSPRNPNGTWYGLLRKGTPVQTRVPLIDDTFGRTVASGLGTEPNSGQGWAAGATTWSANGTVAQASLASANSITDAILPGVCSDDVDILMCTSLSAVTTGAAWIAGIYLRYTDGNNQIRVHTEYSGLGTVFVTIAQVDKGTTTTLVNSFPTSVSYAAGTKLRTRVQAVGPVIRVKVWLDSNAEPAAWTASGTTSTTTNRGNAVGMFAWRVFGNTNAGTLTETVYEYRCDSIRATTPVPEWPTRWDQSGKDSTSPIVGAGIQRRLGQGVTALRSPMYRQISSLTTSLGYWPMEDGADSTGLTNVTANVAGVVAGMAFGSNGPDGSASAITFSNADATSRVSGSFKSASSTAGWQISWAIKLAALPGGAAQMIAWYTNNGYTWTINLAVGFYNIHVIDKDGTVLLDSNVSFTGFDPPNDWVQFRMKATVSGGTVTAEFAWFKQGRSSPFGTTSTFSGTVGALTRWVATGNTQMVNGSICHVFGVTTGNDNLQSYEAMRAFDGYAGETAGARLLRLATEEGVPIVIMGDTTLCAPMGIQSVATFIDLAHECEDAEQGLLIERGLGLGFLTWDFRTNVPVTMALDFAQGHVTDPPEPTDDDQRLTNVVKLTRKNGGEVTATNATSVALSGEYTDEPTVNLQSDLQLPDHAGWRLHLGTIDELRWPQITLDLRRNPGLIPSWCAMRIGSRITIANPPTGIAAGPLDLILEGYTETIGTLSWTVVMTCSPATAWDVAVYDDAGSRKDSTSTVLGVARDTVQTSWTFSTANTAECWTTAAGDYPLDINCGGERVTVTAMGAVTGSGPYTQTATVVRSVNGVVKAQAANTSITLWRPVVRGLQ